MSFYTSIMASAILISGLIALYQLRDVSPFACVLDGLLIAFAGGMIGGRSESAFLYNEAGFAWHGAIIGAVLGAIIGARLRGVSSARLLESLAYSLPIIAAAAWIGCGSHGCAYGMEIDTLADFASAPLLVHEAPDTFGQIAPRYHTQFLGAASAVVVALILTRVKSPMRRLWVGVGLIAACQFIIGSVRGDIVPIVFGLRVDQVLDALIAAWGAVLAWRSRIRSEVLPPHLEAVKGVQP